MSVAETKSKVGSIAPSQSISQRGDFTMKSKVDFPNYRDKTDKKFIDQPKDMYRELGIADNAVKL